MFILGLGGALGMAWLGCCIRHAKLVLSFSILSIAGTWLACSSKISKCSGLLSDFRPVDF